MRGQLLIAVFLGVIGVAMAGDPLKKALRPYMKECIIELDEGVLAKLIFHSRIRENNLHPVRCCLWTKAGFLKDAKMDFPTLEKVLMEADDPKKGLELFTAIRGCQAESEVSDDASVVLGHYLTCIHSRKHG